MLNPSGQTGKMIFKRELKRGDIILVDLEPRIGSEQGGSRPALVIQNDISNRYSSTIIVAPFTSKRYSKEYPTNINFLKEESGLDKDSTLLLNQIRVIDKSRISKKISSIDNILMRKVDLAIKISLALN